MNIKLFGPRALLSQEKPSTRGALLVNPSESIHSLARVCYVGDGNVRMPDGSLKHVPPVVNVGDIVFFQTNAMLATGCTYEIDKTPYLNLLQDDLLARLPSNEVTVANMEMLGRWILIEPYIRQTGTIIMPATINYQEHLEQTFWKLIKKPTNCDLQAELGQEVLINAHRATPVQLGGKAYCYIDQNFILGAVQPEPVVTA